MKSYHRMISLLLLCLFSVFCHSCKQKPAPDVKKEPKNAVAMIGYYIISKDELAKRLMEELQPNPYEYSKQDEVIDANTVLLKIIAEKAMIIEARKRNYHLIGDIHSLTERHRDKMLVNSLLQTYLKDKVVVTDVEIDQAMKANPKLDRAKAKIQMERAMANKLVDDYYDQLCKRFHLKKVTANFSKAAKIHQRLLLYPKESRQQAWILNKQIESDLTEQEKSIALATFDGGEVTLEDWFKTLCDIVPPSRPRDLRTVDGVERLLDRALRLPILVTEAKLHGLDKDDDLIRRVREREDSMLLSKIMNEETKDINEPTEQQIFAYFEKNKELFGQRPSVKINQIWCQDLKTANEAKNKLNNGKDFETVKQNYCLEKRNEPFTAFPSSEGLFWDDLWNSEPNEIIGPIKGFYKDGIKWRIVKIVEKKPSEPREYSSNINNNIKYRVMSERREKVLADLRKKLLKKYPYKIYSERLKDVDPLDIP